MRKAVVVAASVAGSVISIAILASALLPSGRAPPDLSPPAFAQIDEALKKLPRGNVAFSAPETLAENETTDVRLLVSIRAPLRALREELGQVGETEGARVRLTPQMEARLSGQGLAITAITPERQAISTLETTRWRWDVSGSRPGRHDLHLTLSAIISVNGEPTPRVIRVLDRTIKVDVTLRQRISGLLHDHWEFLLAVIAIPLALWLLREWRKRHPKTEDGYGWPS